MTPVEQAQAKVDAIKAEMRQSHRALNLAEAVDLLHRREDAYRELEEARAAEEADEPDEPDLLTITLTEDGKAVRWLVESLVGAQAGEARTIDLALTAAVHAARTQVP